jgi:glutamyl-tRNA synthetase
MESGYWTRSLHERTAHRSIYSRKSGQINAVYDFNRALWYNSQYISALSDTQFVDLLQEYLRTRGGDAWKEILEKSDRVYWLSFAPYIKVRIQTFGQFRERCQYFFKPMHATPDLVYREKMWVTKELLWAIFPELIDLLSDLNTWTEDEIKDILIKFIAKKSLKNGQLLRPLRAILTWVEASPWAFEMLTVLGKEESLARLRVFA